MQGLKMISLPTHECPEKGLQKVFVLLSLQDIFGNLNDAMLNRASTADTLAAVDIKVQL